MTEFTLYSSEPCYDIVIGTANKHGVSARQALDYIIQQWANDREAQASGKLREEIGDWSLAERVKFLEDRLEGLITDLRECEFIE